MANGQSLPLSPRGLPETPAPTNVKIPQQVVQGGYVSANTGNVYIPPKNRFNLPFEDKALRTISRVDRFFESDPVLERISRPSLIKEDIRRTYPVTETAFQGQEIATRAVDEGRLVGFYNPILSAAVPSVNPSNLPRNIKIPTRALKDPYFVEVQQPVSINGKPNTFSKYSIFEETRPPQISLGGKGGYLGYDDALTITPARTRVTGTPLGALEGTPVLTFTTQGGSSGQLNLVGGTSVPRTTAEFNTLSKTEKFLWQRLAEDITGRPVSLKNVPKVIKDSGLSKGDISNFYLGKRKNFGEEVVYDLLSPEGYIRKFPKQRTSQFETTSQFIKAGENSQAEIFKGDIFFKKVNTKIGARATGKTPKLEGTIIKLKETKIIGEDSPITMFRSTETKTPLSTTFQEQVVSSKIAPPKVATKPKTSTKVSLESPQRTSSLTTTGINLGTTQPSQFQQEVVVSQTIPPVIRQSNIPQSNFGITNIDTTPLSLNTNQNQNVGQPTLQLERQIDLLGINQTPNLNQLQSQDNRLLQNNLVSQTPKGLNKQTQTPFLGQVQNQSFQQLGLESRTITSTTPSSTRKSPPPIVPLFPKLVTSPKGKKKKIKSALEDDFEVFVKKKGKDIPIGEFESLGEATSKLRSNLTSTLRASGFISKGGEKIPFEEIGLNRNTFRPAKRDPFRVVQKRSKRLSSSGEVFQIKRAKKQSSRGGFF